jgi:hypothetical protein
MKDVFTIIEKEGWDKNIWRKVGNAFENRDRSLTLFLDALPVNGKLHVRERKVKQSASSGEESQFGSE